MESPGPYIKALNFICDGQIYASRAAQPYTAWLIAQYDKEA